ncbi:hypothetical protein SAMN02745823_01915 [Sporobacter termitidis DSM 10068]|uniref:Uncharacterized protein n=1 Tax=Sporobacter termitidis DSM 10068 TaxID=1123282 RepID=A0A1M5XP28_9FIRM|nr:hypothetical protein [Sporobacter termitidis]SHI01585.1 hypothetical protein SAMN02745823_01915 [Sporobacter termitidis DSM 10068]
MENNSIAAALREIALMLDRCADDVPYELSAQDNLYFRMVDAAKEARALIKDMQAL